MNTTVLYCDVMAHYRQDIERKTILAVYRLIDRYIVYSIYSRLVG